MIGETVSHYRILDRLGGGGMGIVYKALDLRLDRVVALKFLASQRGAPEDEKKRFLREARAASSLDHPNICTLYEIGETEDGAVFLAMAFCEGETLRERLDGGPLTVAEAVEIACQIAAGLAKAHERGVIHRDIKPANVILTRDGMVKIVDFGIARLTDQSRLTRAGTAMGTLSYMPPEQFRGEAADARADVWSLGVVLYEMVAGRLPFEGSDEREIVRGILHHHPPSMSALRSGVPPALDRIVERALSKHPDDRPPDMERMLAELRDLTPGLKTSRSGDDGDQTLLDLPRSPTHAAPALPEVPGEGLIGRKIGPYRVLEYLGGGGMGVVYQAEDTRLSRVVALKFLPPELTRDPDAKARFMLEARAASALDHPNLCTILELGEAVDGRLYLAMPRYDGETLRRRIGRGPLPLEEVLEISEQIARGLTKAHRNGIVHRDLKPANIMITGDGVVKILDFGLAKLMGAAVSRTGSAAGTPAYMAPEQALGETVDARADLWSLGVVLYEMLAGHRPFRGEHEQAVIHSLLKASPEPLDHLRPEVPPVLARMVERLLAKSPADRYPTLDEPLAILRELRGQPLTGTLQHDLERRRRLGWWGAALIAAALAGWVLYLLLGRAGGSSQAPPVKTSFHRLTDQEGREWFPTLSPDGDFFAYVRTSPRGDLDIYLQRIGGGNPIPLTGDSPVDDTHPAFSPDGERIAFRSERDGGGVFVMGATGESVKRVTRFGYNPAWSPDGKEILVATEGVGAPDVRKTDSRIWRVDVASGQSKLVVTSDSVQPSWSPGGHRIAYWGVPLNSAKRVLWTVSADGGDAVQVTDDDYLNWNPVWSPDGKYLYFSSNRGGSMNLWRLPIDEATGRARGEAEPITTPSQWSGMMSLARDGRRILFATREGRSYLERVGLDPDGPAVTGPLTPVTQGYREVNYCRVSPDGQWLAFATGFPQEDLFVTRIDGSGLRQLTDDIFRDRNPGWSPDGRRILFYSDRGGRYDAWTIAPDGSDIEQMTATRGEPIFFPLWSPDGRRLVCGLGYTGPALIDPARPLRQRTPERLPDIPRGGPFFAFSWSPDGKRLAGTTGERGIFLFSLESRRYEQMTGHGMLPTWLHDGRNLVYLHEGKIFALDSRTKASRQLLAPPVGSSFVGLDVAPDDRALYVVRADDQGEICEISLP
ncbi:MAG TPA: protein kinase [Thermoanaerobaculia bacterium]